MIIIHLIRKVKLLLLPPTFEVFNFAQGSLAGGFFLFVAPFYWLFFAICRGFQQLRFCTSNFVYTTSSKKTVHWLRSTPQSTEHSEIFYGRIFIYQ